LPFDDRGKYILVVAKTFPFACQAVLRYETVMITLDKKNLSNKLAQFFYEIEGNCLSPFPQLRVRKA
jgi:hypothetical protein